MGVGANRAKIASWQSGVYEAKPMAITWQLAVPLPGDLYASFAAAVA